MSEMAPHIFLSKLNKHVTETLTRVIAAVLTENHSVIKWLRLCFFCFFPLFFLKVRCSCLFSRYSEHTSRFQSQQQHISKNSFLPIEKKNSHETLLVPVLQFVHHSPASLFKLLKLGISSNYSIANLAPYLLLIFVCFLLPPTSPLPAASLKSSFTPHIISLLCSFSQGSCKQALVASTPPNKFSDLSSTTVE